MLDLTTFDPAKAAVTISLLNKDRSAKTTEIAAATAVRNARTLEREQIDNTISAINSLSTLSVEQLRAITDLSNNVKNVSFQLTDRTGALIQSIPLGALDVENYEVEITVTAAIFSPTAGLSPAGVYGNFLMDGAAWQQAGPGNRTYSLTDTLTLLQGAAMGRVDAKIGDKIKFSANTKTGLALTISLVVA